MADLSRYDLGPNQPDPHIGDPEKQRSYYYTDTGFIAQNVYLYAASEGLAAWFHNCNRNAIRKELSLKDGVLVIERDDLKMVFIKNPQDLKNGYNFRIKGVDRGEYDLDIGLISDGRVVETAELRDQPIGLDEEISIPLAVKTEGDKLKGLAVGEEAEKIKKEKDKKSLVLYIIIGLAGLAVVVAAVAVVVIILIKKKKK